MMERAESAVPNVNCQLCQLSNAAVSFALGGGRWDFRFCVFGQVLVRFSVFDLKNCGFSVLLFRAVCGFSPI